MQNPAQNMKVKSGGAFSSNAKGNKLMTITLNPNGSGHNTGPLDPKASYYGKPPLEIGKKAPILKTHLSWVKPKKKGQMSTIRHTLGVLTPPF